jgi:hypothetical protein
MKRNIWPAVQFNFVWDDENPTRGLTKSDEVTLLDEVPFPGSGFVSMRCFPGRVLITTTSPPEDHKRFQEIFENNIRKVLIENQILA